MSNTLAYRSESNVGSAYAAPERADRPAPIRARHIVTKRAFSRTSDGIKHPVTTRRVGDPR